MASKAAATAQPDEAPAPPISKALPWPRRPALLDKDLCGPSMPMAKLVFREGFDAPGIQLSTIQDQRVTTQGGSRSRYTLEFYPRIRHYRVTRHLVEHDEPILVPESHIRYAVEAAAE